MNRLDTQEQVSRNRRKFFMKYGFDIIQYTEMMVTGYTDEEILGKMGISSEQLDHFRNDLNLNKLKSKVII